MNTLTRPTLICLVLTLSTSTALAEFTWQTDDTVRASFAATAGSATGALVGGFLGYTSGDCDEESLCFREAQTVVSGLLGSTVGVMTGMAIYGQNEGLDGSLWATALGSFVGMFAGGSLGSVVSDEVGIGGLFVGQIAGAVAGYAWTAEPVDDPVLAHGGLLDFDDQHGLRLAMPTGGVLVQQDGSLGYQLTLAAGTW